MQKTISIFFRSMVLLYLPLPTHAQEDPTPDIEIEKSAEVFLEDYSDEFQDNFFEALKQKGIENYDKAIHLFLKCKQLDASNPVVDHELAKGYYENKEYPLAEEYALTALQSAPENLWYADTWVQILQKQGKSVEKLTNELPFGHAEFIENLAQIYFEKGNYNTALAILKESKQSSFNTAFISKINDSLEKRKARAADTSLAFEKTNTEPNDIEVYKMRIAALIRADSYPTLQEVSEEALESYPSQPYFYYAQGYALNKRGKHQEAVETLEAALDYLIDDTSLANKINQELADGYTALNNAVKANMYLRKIKPGF